MAVESSPLAVLDSHSLESSAAVPAHQLPLGRFQFVILASLRAVQLTRGCRPRIDGVHKNTVIAQLEVSQGKVMQVTLPLSAVSTTLVEA